MPDQLNKKEKSLNTSDFNVSSNNVNGLQSSKKQLKHFQLFINKISPKFFFVFTQNALLKSHRKVTEWCI